MPRKSTPIKHRSLDVGIQLLGGQSPFSTFTAVIISAKDSQRDIVLSKSCSQLALFSRCHDFQSWQNNAIRQCNWNGNYLQQFLARPKDSES